MRPIVVIAAVPRETALLELMLADATWMPMPGFTAVRGFVGNLPVIVCVSGVGKINAAAATAVMIERHHPALVISAGCGGAYPGSNLAVGGLAVATAEIMADEGVQTSAGWLDLKEINLPSFAQGKQRYYNEIPLSIHAAEKAMQLADYCGITMVRGRFATVSACSGTLERGEELARRLGVVCENMEGAAVALTAIRFGIDCLEVRGISNLVEERNFESWDIPRAAEVAQRFVLKYIEGLDQPTPFDDSEEGD